VKISLTINGRPETWDVAVNETLLDAVRRQGYTGTKRVCESGECGACAVIVNGLAVDSCILLAAQADGAQVVTVEGLERNPSGVSGSPSGVSGSPSGSSGSAALHPVQEAFAENGSVQCGFCIPGMVVTAANYLESNPNPTEEDVRHLFVGNLCRCTGYKKPVEAVLSAARAMGGGR